VIPPDDDPERDDPGAGQSEPDGDGDDDSGDEDFEGDASEGDASGEEARDEAAPGDEPFEEDEPAEDEAPPAREPGYLWTFDEQEARLPDHFATHMDVLDEMEAPEILDLDLGRADDYLLWAAAQSLEEQEWTSQAIDLLRRIDASKKTHAALCYPEIRLRLHDLLRERGDYEEALAILDRVERDDPERRETCRERRAEVLILTGRAEEGLALFESAARAIPDDPWVPLAAAWALVRSGDYDGAPAWIKRAEHAARRLEDEEEIQSVDAEVERLQTEARIRSERQKRVAATAAAPVPAPAKDSAPAGVSMPAEGSAPAQRAPVDAEAARQEILGLLDAEEVRMTRTPPRTEQEKSAAVASLAALHHRASSGWDDAVERHDDQAIATFDDLQWEIVGVAERFGLKLPGVES
jgi:tetratricopeptide (TPR) repeat protein